jgi:hypothetical protein
MDQVGLAEHAYQIAVFVENRKGADIVLREKFGRFGTSVSGRTVTTSRTITSIARISPASE